MTMLNYMPVTGRRRWRGLTLLTLIVLAMFAAWRWNGVWREWGAYHYALYRLERASPDPGRLVYEEEPARATTLRRNPSEYGTLKRVLFDTLDDRPPPGWAPPACFVGPQTALLDKCFPTLRGYWLFAFALRRTTPSGQSCLVVTQYDTSMFASPTRRVGFEMRTMLTPWAIRRPASAVRWSALGLTLKGQAFVRFFAARPDPADPSRFTVAYEVNDIPGAISAKLHDDGAIEFALTKDATKSFSINSPESYPLREFYLRDVAQSHVK